MKATAIILFIIAVEIALLIGLRIQEQYQEIAQLKQQQTLLTQQIESLKAPSISPM